MFGPQPIQAFHINKQRKNDLLHFKRESFLTLAANDAVLLKFIYSEKAAKFYEISTVVLSFVVPVKYIVQILQNFVAFSEYMSFKGQ